MIFAAMRLHVINPCNPLVSMAQRSRWRKYRVWKPLGLTVIAALKPREEWDVTIIDENLRVPGLWPGQKQPNRSCEGAARGYHGVAGPVTINISRGTM